MPAPSPTPAFSAEAAWQLLRLRRPALALALTDRLLARDPASLPALLARTEALRQLSRLPDALANAQAAVMQAPQAASAFYSLAQVRGQQGALWEADTAVREALRLDPHNATYYGFLAQLCYLLARPDEAIVHASAGLAVNAYHADCLLWRALGQDQCGQQPAADADFKRALRLAPTSALLHQRWGEALLQRPDPAGAAQHLAEALRLNPLAAATLLPAVRRARRWQHWPAWMVRRHQHLRREWQRHGVLLYSGGGTLLLLPYFLLLAWWHTRRDPLFQLSRAQLWRRWLVLWLASPFLLAIGIFAGGYVGLIDIDAPLSLGQMSGMVLGGGFYSLGIFLIKKQIDS